VIPSPSLSMG